VPLVAAVQGNAVGVGTTMLLHCDLVYLADNAKLITPFVNLALVPEAASSLLMPLRIGYARAFEMFALGEPVDASSALAWGLVNKVVPESELDAAIAHFTDIIKNRSATVVTLGKRAFYGQIERDIEGAYALAGSVMACNMLEPDAREGIDAFLGKRAPKWNG